MAIIVVGSGVPGIDEGRRFEVPDAMIPSFSWVPLTWLDLEALVDARYAQPKKPELTLGAVEITRGLRCSLCPAKKKADPWRPPEPVLFCDSTWTVAPWHCPRHSGLVVLDIYTTLGVVGGKDANAWDPCRQRRLAKLIPDYSLTTDGLVRCLEHEEVSDDSGSFWRVMQGIQK